MEEEPAGIAIFKSVSVRDEAENLTEEIANLDSLPFHIKETIQGAASQLKFRRKGLDGEGLLHIDTIVKGLDTPLEILPWERDHKPHKKTPYHARKESRAGYLTRGQRHAPPPASYEAVNKYKKFDKMMHTMKYNKIMFTNSHVDIEAIPSWAKNRLENVCKAIRYELPSDKKSLEQMTPLVYLANFTRLTRDLNRRYTKVFLHYKTKQTDTLTCENLYDALNSMFGKHLGYHNFEILRTALFLEEDDEINLKTFLGICSWTDRLFWATYLDQSWDTFLYWGPNRTALEYVDFSYLNRKLEGLSVPKEISILLRSLS